MGEIPQRAISEAVNEAPEYDKAPDEAEIFRIVNESGLAQKVKLYLIEAALNPDKYIDMLEAAIRPVAEEFVKCREIWQPLIDIYGDSYKEYISAKKLIEEKCKYENDESVRFAVYPSVVCFASYSTSVYELDGEKNEGVMNIMGVLYDALLKTYTQECNMEAEVSHIMDVLGDPNRFRMVMRLTKGAAYGRELAEHVSLAPCTVSQYLSSLVGMGLVESSIEGNRVYYSLNQEQIDRFLEMQRKLFKGE